jgi:hypothetical protein
MRATVRLLLGAKTGVAVVSLGKLTNKRARGSTTAAEESYRHRSSSLWRECTLADQYEREMDSVYCPVLLHRRFVHANIGRTGG